MVVGGWSLVVRWWLVVGCWLLSRPDLERGLLPGRCGTPARFRSSATTRQTGEVGGAVQSRVFSVGNGVLWADANVGVAATQAIVDVAYGPQALALLRQGLAPEAIVKQIWERGSRSAARELDQAGPSVRRHESRRASTRHSPDPKATDMGGPQERQVLHGPGQHPRGAAVVANMIERRSRTRPAICRSGSSPRSRAVRPGGRHARPAVGGARHRQEELRRLASQRHRAASAGGRQPEPRSPNSGGSWRSGTSGGHVPYRRSASPDEG